MTEEQLGLTSGSGTHSTRGLSFTEEDNDEVLERLFSGDNGNEASNIVYQLMFGDYENEQEKEDLLSRFKHLAKQASREYLEEREQS